MNRPFALSDHMVGNKFCWDANNFSGTFKTKDSRAGLVLAKKKQKITYILYFA